MSGLGLGNRLATITFAMAFMLPSGKDSFFFIYLRRLIHSALDRKNGKLFLRPVFLYIINVRGRRLLRFYRCWALLYIKGWGSPSPAHSLPGSPMPVGDGVSIICILCRSGGSASRAGTSCCFQPLLCCSARRSACSTAS